MPDNDIKARLADSYLRGFRAAAGEDYLAAWDIHDSDMPAPHRSSWIAGYDSGTRSLKAAKRRAAKYAEEVTS